LRLATLDDFLEVPDGKSMVLIGPPGSGKTVLCQNILCEALRNDLSCMSVLTQSPPQETIECMKSLGLDTAIKNPNRFIIVDLYSWVLGETVSGAYSVSNLSDLAGVNVVLSSAADALGGDSIVVFDTISTLVNYNSEDLTVRFLRSHLARMKKLRNTGFYAVEGGIQTESFYNSLRLLFDGVLELKLIENEGKLERLIRVHSLKVGSHDTSWRSFKIVNRAFQIGPEGGREDWSSQRVLRASITS